MTSLGELVNSGLIQVGDGYRTKKAELSEHGIPILRVADVADGRLNPSFTDRISESMRSKIGSKLSRVDDVLITTKGTVGRAAIVPGSFPEHAYSPQLCFLRVIDRAQLDPRWIYYWVRSPAFAIQAAAVMGQTDMAPYVSLGDLKRFDITPPLIHDQRRIAGVLGALDDLIDTNQEQVAQLVRLAYSIFEDFRPETSIDTSFGDVADVFGGGTPSTKNDEYWGGAIAWATPSDITALNSPYLFETGRQITEQGLDACSSELHPMGSILMTSRATIGAFAINHVPVATNQGFIVVRPRTETDRSFLFHEMRSRVEEFIAQANGSTFLELSRGRFKAMKVRWPSESERGLLHSRIEPLHTAAAALVEEISQLRRTRDELLPLLMSGRVRVAEAEKIIS